MLKCTRLTKNHLASFLKLPNFEFPKAFFSLTNDNKEDLKRFKELNSHSADYTKLIKSAHTELSYSVSEPHNMHLLCDTIYGRLSSTAMAKPDDICYKYSFTNTTLKFEELVERVDNLAQSLLNLGYNKGDRLALLLPNVFELNLFILAAQSIGVTIVLMNPAYQLVEIEYMLKKTSARGVVIMDNLKSLQHYETLKTICPNLEHSNSKELNLKELPHLKNIFLVNFDLTSKETNLNLYKGTIPFKNIQFYNKVKKPLPYVDMDDSAFILFTVSSILSLSNFFSVLNYKFINFFSLLEWHNWHAERRCSKSS